MVKYIHCTRNDDTIVNDDFGIVIKSTIKIRTKLLQNCDTFVKEVKKEEIECD